MKNYLPVIIVFGLLLIGIAGFIVFNNKETTETTTIKKKSSSISPVLNQGKLIIGNAAAKATIVEYFDYKCPSCNNFHRTIGKEIEQNYIDSGQAKYEIRITPIIGPDSANAARGAYCANDQNVFESYHNTILDYMYDNYYKDNNYSAEYDDILTTTKLAELSSPLGIDESQFKACIDSDKFNSDLDDNLLAAADDGVRGTPGFAVGEQSFVGGQPYSVFKTLLDIELR